MGYILRGIYATWQIYSMEYMLHVIYVLWNICSMHSHVFVKIKKYSLICHMKLLLHNDSYDKTKLLTVRYSSKNKKLYYDLHFVNSYMSKR